jgi:hypothetical protein
MVSPTLPFSNSSRCATGGFGVGLHEYIALGSCSKPGARPIAAKIRNGIAALISRHDDDIRAIKKLFDEFYRAGGWRDEARRARRFALHVRATREERV